MGITSNEERTANRLADLERRFDAFISQDKPGSQLFTAGYVPFGGTNGALTTSANLTYDGTDLEIKMTSAYPAVNIQEASTSARRATIGFGVNTPTATTGWIIGQGLNNNTVKDFYMIDLTAGVVRLYIDTGGNIGIGTTAPAAKLDVTNGYIRALNGTNTAPASGQGLELVTTGGTSFIIAYNRGSSAFTNLNIQTALIDFAMNSVNIARLHSNGLYLGGVIAPSKTLEIATDSAGKPTTNTWQVISDDSTKKYTRPFTNGLQALRALPKPIEFEYNGDFNTPDDGIQGTGYSAQDLAKVAPKMVRTTHRRRNDDDPTLYEILETQTAALQQMLHNAILELDDRLIALEKKANNNGKP